MSLIAILAIAIVGCDPPPTCATNMPARLTDVGTSPTNVFKMVIPANPALAPNSAAIISRQISIMAATHTEVYFGFDGWSAPVFYTDSTTNKTTNVQLLSSYCNGGAADGGATSCGPIRWKSCMSAGSESDRPIWIVDTVDRCFYEGWGWGGCALGNTPRAWWLGALSLDDADQVWDPYEGLGGTAGGNLGYSSTVWPDEVSTSVNHALCFAADWNVNNPSRVAWPFWHRDGAGTSEDDLFQGMRVQLNPSYDISGLPTYKRNVAQAMKTYGMYDMNSNFGHWATGGPNPQGYTNNCWNGVLPADVVAAKSFRVVPVAQFRVLAVDTWNTRPNDGICNNSCLSYGGTGKGTPPTISSISPTSGATGTTVSLTGTNMSNGYNVRFGDTVATNMNIVSSTLVTCTVPSITTGAGTVKVSYRTTSGGGSNLKDFSYTCEGVPAPALSGIAPTSGSAAGGTSCTLTGTNLTGCSKVSFGGLSATGINVVSSTQVRCTSPAGAAPGIASVMAFTGSGSSNSVDFTFGTASGPTLSAIAPTSGTTAGGTACTLTGTNLTDCSAVSFGGTAATGIVVDSATQVRCTSPAKSAGAISVTATTANGTSGGVTYTYTAPPSPPTLSAIAPTSGTTSGGTACTLTGTNLTGCSAVSFGGTAATGITVDSATQVRCTSPAKTAGTYSVTATTPGGTSGGVNYTYTAGGTSYTSTLYPSDDTYVLNSQSTKNFNGANLVFQANTINDNWPFLKFNMTSASGTTVTTAKLRLYWGGTSTSYPAKVYSCSTDTWTESTLKWSNKPAIGTVQANFTINPTAGWHEIDLTSYVNAEFAGDKIVTFVIRDDQYQNKMAQAYSKETGGTDYKPQLVVITQ